MAVPNNSSLTAEHRRHDRLLVARFAAGDAAPGQEHEAQDLIRRCSDCAALAADISAISKSVAQLPSPRRPRDFRLSSSEADRLRGSRLDRWLRTITGSGWATVRPVAAVALSIGLVMSVVGGLPMLGAAGAGAPADTLTQRPIAAVPTPGATTDIRVASPSAATAPEQGSVPPMVGPVVGSMAGNSLDNAYLQPTAAPTQQQLLPPPPQATQPQATSGSAKDLTSPLPGPGTGTRDTLLIAGVAVTILALILLALLYTARRRYYDPLLR